MQVTLTTISRKDKTSSAGKPYVSLGIKTQEHGDRWLSGFGRKENKDWKAGDKVEIIIDQKGQYLNFSMPETAKAPAGYSFTPEEKERLFRIDTNVQAILRMMSTQKDDYPSHTPTAFDENPIN